MKKYFIFRNNGNTIMTDVKEDLKENDKILVLKGKTHLKFTNIVFGSFLKVVTETKMYKTEEPRYEYKVLPDGGFSVYDKIRKETEEFRSLNIKYNPKEGYIMEFPDDASAEVWVEAMKGDYNERKSWWD